jgi:hypothetical protein
MSWSLAPEHLLADPSLDPLRELRLGFEPVELTESEGLTESTLEEAVLLPLLLGERMLPGDAGSICDIQEPGILSLSESKETIVGPLPGAGGKSKQALSGVVSEKLTTTCMSGVIAYVMFCDQRRLKIRNATCKRCMRRLLVRIKWVMSCRCAWRRKLQIRLCRPSPTKGKGRSFVAGMSDDFGLCRMQILRKECSISSGSLCNSVSKYSSLTKVPSLFGLTEAKRMLSCRNWVLLLCFQEVHTVCVENSAYRRGSAMAFLLFRGTRTYRRARQLRRQADGATSRTWRKFLGGKHVLRREREHRSTVAYTSRFMLRIFSSPALRDHKSVSHEWDSTVKCRHSWYLMRGKYMRKAGVLKPGCLSDNRDLKPKSPSMEMYREGIRRYV